MTIAIQIAVPATILDAITVTGAGFTLALPARATVIGWQTSFDVAPDAVNITLRISMDGILWTVLDTSTAVAGEFRNVDGFNAAVFIDCNVVTNTGTRAATVQVICKAI